MTSDIHAAGLEDQAEWLQTRPGERCLPRVAVTGTNGACPVVGILSHPSDSMPMHVDHLQQGIAIRTVGRPITGSSLVRRLVLAKDDPAKQRIRAWLSNTDDERLFCLGLTSEDIAALRGTASPLAEPTIAQGLDATAEAAAGYV